jgi:nucleoside-diphosphate-sugar epimerase
MQVSKNVLITGSTGLIGRALVSEFLLKDKYSLRLQVRNIEKARAEFAQLADSKNLELVECDFYNCSDLEINELCKNCDTVVHLAGLVHRPEASLSDYELLNVLTTKRLIRAAQKNKIDTFLLLSSSAVYGTGPFCSADEDAPLQGDSPYAVSKIACEQILKEQNDIERLISLRPAMVFGEGDRGNLIKLIKSINKKRYVQIGNGQTLKSLIYSRDMARVIIGCLEKLSSGKYVMNVANPEAISMKNLSSEIWYTLGHDGNIPSLPKAFLEMALGVTDKFFPGKLPVNKAQLNKLNTETTLNVDKLVAMIDFRPDYTVAAALRAEIKWAKDKKLI